MKLRKNKTGFAPYFSIFFTGGETHLAAADGLEGPHFELPAALLAPGMSFNAFGENVVGPHFLVHRHSFERSPRRSLAGPRAASLCAATFQSSGGSAIRQTFPCV